MSECSGQWEYRVLRPHRESTMKEIADPSAQLNELGEERWELAETIDYVGGGTKFLVMKRPVTDDASDGG